MSTVEKLDRLIADQLKPKAPAPSSAGKSWCSSKRLD